jgi:hypothetical protein
MPGLSPDPTKAARQLAGLAQSNSLLAARLAVGEEPAADPAPAVRPSASPAGGAAPGTVAGLPVRPADHQEAPRAQDPEPEPTDVVEPEPGGGADPDPADERELEPAGGERGGWAAFREGLLGG